MARVRDARTTRAGSHCKTHTALRVPTTQRPIVQMAGGASPTPVDHIHRVVASEAAAPDEEPEHALGEAAGREPAARAPREVPAPPQAAAPRPA
eukprot:2214029-Prymnesium_polylepis.1